MSEITANLTSRFNDVKISIFTKEIEVDQHQNKYSDLLLSGDLIQQFIYFRLGFCINFTNYSNLQCCLHSVNFFQYFGVSYIFPLTASDLR